MRHGGHRVRSVDSLLQKTARPGLRAAHQHSRTNENAPVVGPASESASSAVRHYFAAGVLCDVHTSSPAMSQGTRAYTHKEKAVNQVEGGGEGYVSPELRHQLRLTSASYVELPRVTDKTSVSEASAGMPVNDVQRE